MADEDKPQKPPPPEPAPETKLDGTPIGAEEDEVSDLNIVLPGTKLGSAIEDGRGRWEVGPTLRAGGMGTVYRGKDRRLNNSVAIKLIRGGEGAPEVRRFGREARELGALSHPNIVRVLDFGYQDGIAYMVMDMLDGEDLDDRYTAGRSYTFETASELYRIAGLIGHALIAAHARGVVHRDIKPANIFLRFDGAELVPVLVDFGIVGMFGERLRTAKTRQMTLAGAIIGTPGYMSHEQLSKKVVGPETDLYSLAAVVYQGLVGCLPYDRSMGATNNPYLLAEVIKDAMEAPGELEFWVKKIPGWVQTDVRNALSKALDHDPQKRGTMEEFVEVMKRYGKVNASPRTPTPPQKPGTVDLNAPTGELVLPSRRPKWPVAVAGGVTISLATLLVIQLSTPPKARSSRDAGAAAARPQLTVATRFDAGPSRDSALANNIPVIPADASIEYVGDVPVGFISRRDGCVGIHCTLVIVPGDPRWVANDAAVELQVDATSEDEDTGRHGRHRDRDNRHNSSPPVAQTEAEQLRAQLVSACCAGQGGGTIAEQLRTDPVRPVRGLELCQAPTESPCDIVDGDRRPWCRLCQPKCRRNDRRPECSAAH